jgi:hypothetical protein
MRLQLRTASQETDLAGHLALTLDSTDPSLSNYAIGRDNLNLKTYWRVSKVIRCHRTPLHVRWRHRRPKLSESEYIPT